MLLYLSAQGQRSKMHSACSRCDSYMKGFQPSRRGAARDCVEIMECGCQEAADRATGPAAALTLAASTSPGLVIVNLGPPDAGLAAVACLLG